MVFSSQVFLFLFLPATYLLYLVIRHHKARNILLVVASLVFYAYGEPMAVLLMILSIVCNYVFGRLVADEKRKTRCLSSPSSSMWECCLSLSISPIRSRCSAR